ncbi:glycosyltransferase family 4 protein [Flavobacterium undicola]|uniref:glycosyltransferase family 4 protein n=1 Tax=Flavobacterium undicola TaxID=1932779 RepID=UPI0013786A8E|nr:glycosyltransferase family 4 protein [Flavobacterium undicola]MBA0882494.1 glycosyltransferase family 4 protein [Flavobacterium undicola]
MKRILVISSSPFFSGAEISLMQLLEKIDTKYQLMLITGNVDHFKHIKMTKYLEIDSITDKVSWSSFLRKTFVINYKCFYQIVKFKPEVIYFNTTNSFLNFIWLGILFFRTKKIWHVRDNLKNKKFIKKLKLFSNLIVCNSVFINNQLNANFKGKVIYGGIDIDKYKNTNRQKKLKTVACIAQLTLWKNQIDFIKAAQIIHKKNAEVEFLIIGDILNPKDIKYKELLIEYVKNHDLVDVIKFVGFQNDVIMVLSEIDVLIHPAIEEPFGRVLIEAMSMEIPVVGYKSGGPQEVIVNNETGYLVAPYDYALLATKTTELLENDDLRLKFGQEGRKRVAKKFYIEKYVNDMEKLFM